MAGYTSNPHTEAPRNDPWEMWRDAAIFAKSGAEGVKLSNQILQTIIDHPGAAKDLKKQAAAQIEASNRPPVRPYRQRPDEPIPF